MNENVQLEAIMLSRNTIENVLLAALSKGGDFAEIYMEESSVSSISMMNGRVDKATSGMDFGIGIRILEHTKCVYVYSNDIREETLVRLAIDASSSLQSLPASTSICLNSISHYVSNPYRIAPVSVAKSEKAEFLRRASEAAKAYDPIISQTSASYGDVHKNIWIANSTGLYRSDDRTRTRFMIEAVASSGGEKQSGYFAPGS